MHEDKISRSNTNNEATLTEQTLAALPPLANESKRQERSSLFIDDCHADEASVVALHASRPLARQVYNQHLTIWDRLKREALRARASYVFTARAAAVANFRGQGERSQRLVRLAYKQRLRWCDASRALDFFEN